MGEGWNEAHSLIWIFWSLPFLPLPSSPCHLPEERKGDGLSATAGWAVGKGRSGAAHVWSEHLRDQSPYSIVAGPGRQWGKWQTESGGPPRPEARQPRQASENGPAGSQARPLQTFVFLLKESAEMKKEGWLWRHEIPKEETGGAANTGEWWVVGGNGGVGAGDGVHRRGRSPLGLPLQPGACTNHWVPRDARHLAHLAAKRGGENEEQEGWAEEKKAVQEARLTALRASTFVPGPGARS